MQMFSYWVKTVSHSNVRIRFYVHFLEFMRILAFSSSVFFLMRYSKMCIKNRWMETQLMKQEERPFVCRCSFSILKAEGCKFCDTSDRIFFFKRIVFKKISSTVCHWLDREIVLPQNDSVRLVWMLK